MKFHQFMGIVTKARELTGKLEETSYIEYR